jgi:hypothetical protein
MSLGSDHSRHCGSFPGSPSRVSGQAVWRSIAATFQALPGASFVVNGAAQASDSALTTAINGWSAAATFEGEFSNVTRSYAGNGVVRYVW